MPTDNDNPPAEIACSLDGRGLESRRRRWRALADSALLHSGRAGDSARQVYRPGQATERELSELVALEAACCPFLEFKLVRDEEVLILDVRGPDEATSIVDVFAEAAGCATTGAGRGAAGRGERGR